ncbi:hypothetical protein [Flavobacterium wongokense]|uniref:hypothetical protein n=1 Tax=Flavobacterium wongokense TaxID=2910674 RepID=UPI001F3F69E3|nr:hypothetical protein [Flavobacterium sp. WG47]MCF6132253.1 hypothetical protein [Flavobacterium sp. WG47]
MKYLCCLLVLITSATLTAQKIKLKKEVVYIDELPVFSYGKKAMGNELYVYKLNTKEELLNMVVDNNNTESKVDDSKRIVFAKQNTTIQSRNFRGRDYEFLIGLLLEEHVIDPKGEINLNSLVRFKSKFDDGNINHINRN